MEIPDQKHLQAEIDILVDQMNQPGMAANSSKMKELSLEHSNKSELLSAVTTLNNITAEKNEAIALAESEDEELKLLAQEDLLRLQEEEQKAFADLSALLIEQDPRDERDVILEIRSGAGGDEAGLFAAELMRAYIRYAEKNNWEFHIVSQSFNDQGGYKEVIAEISGKNVFGTLKYERGVHRVQRIPETEKQGRIHTSTITVAVMPEAEEMDIEIRNEDLRIDTYRASGAGGQHVNKTSSAVRITHLPTNTVVAVQDERSQHKNKAKAMKVLRTRLLETQEEEREKKETAERKKQVGTGDRSEKIRTYNFPQDRITDHRIKESWSGIEQVMAGNMDQIFQDLQEADQKLKANSRNPK